MNKMNNFKHLIGSNDMYDSLISNPNITRMALGHGINHLNPILIDYIGRAWKDLIVNINLPEHKIAELIVSSVDPSYRITLMQLVQQDIILEMDNGKQIIQEIAKRNTSNIPLELISKLVTKS